MEFLSRELLIRIVGRIVNVKFLVIADVRATQVLVERLHGLFGADVTEHAVCL